MKYIRFAIINIIVFSVLLFGISLLFPSSSNIAKSVTINRDRNTCLRLCGDTAQWKAWNSLSRQMAGKSVMSRQQTDTTFSVVFKNEADMITDSYIFYNPDSMQTILTWQKAESLRWYTPFKKFRAMINNKQLSVEMDSSLSKLKNLVEGLPTIMPGN